MLRISPPWGIHEVNARVLPRRPSCSSFGGFLCSAAAAGESQQEQKAPHSPGADSWGSSPGPTVPSLDGGGA